VKDLEVIGALAEPTRRALYELVADHGDWMGRDAAADALGLERATAAHHLDRLAADGLLEVDYQRLTGRKGPGAGRPSKLYRRARRDVGVSLPPRDYELAGRLLAQAADRSRTEGTDIDSALDATAGEEGKRIAEDIRSRLQGRDRQKVAVRRQAVMDALQERGFEPRVAEDGTVVLRNCPFHQLAQQHTDLICGMNECLMTSALETVGNTGLEARLEPEEGLCCVKLHPSR
jgi:predicted ArsR family transcriptional regulator